MNLQKIPFFFMPLLMMAACTSDELASFTAALASAAEEEAYESRYTYGGGYGGGGYGGAYYAPYSFSTYSGWPSYYQYGQYVGPWACRHTGSFYTCDSDGDGYADMYGNTDDGSYASSNLRVNGRGQAFMWDDTCNCWERAPAYDGPRRKYHDRYDRYERDTYDDGDRDDDDYYDRDDDRY